MPNTGKGSRGTANEQGCDGQHRELSSDSLRFGVLTPASQPNIVSNDLATQDIRMRNIEISYGAMFDLTPRSGLQSHVS